MTEDEALTIARRACEERGLNFREPASAYRSWRGVWSVLSPANQRGGNTVVVISKGGRKIRIRHYKR